MIQNVLEHLLGKKEKLIKKWALDREGRLRLYTCPPVQVALLNVLREHGKLDELLAEYDKEMEEN